MRHESQVALARKIFGYIDTKSTARVDSVYYNEVAAYTSPERLALERAILFREYPLLIGLGCQIRNPGDVLTNDDTDVPILVVRAESGRLNAFINVCRHRGNKVVEGCGAGKRDLMCPYHGWTYDHDGQLVGVPDSESFAGMDRSGHGLVPLPLVEKYGVVWVVPKPGAPIEIDAHLAGLEEDLASYALETYHHYQTRTIRRKINWKMMTDTFLETYHFATLHQATVGPIFHPNLATYDPFGLNVRLVGVRKSIAAMRAQPEETWDLVPHSGIVNAIFPNTVLVIQGDHIETWQAYPAGNQVDECVM